MLTRARQQPAGRRRATRRPACTRALDAVPHRHPAEAVRHIRGRSRRVDRSVDRAGSSASDTQLASLELAIEGRDLAGSCDIGFSCAYTNTIVVARRRRRRCRWRTIRASLFERMFGDSGSTDRRRAPRRIATDRSILDSVSDRIATLQRPHRRRATAPSSTEYLEAVRDIERRIQKAEEQSGRELPIVDQPAGVPASFEEHAKLMFDLQVLAYQTDLTRVITFMLGRELSGRTYPELGVPESHHPTSHHQDDPGKLANLREDQDVHHDALFAVLPREAAGHARRRRLAARSHADPLRRGHGRLEPARARATCRCCSPAARRARIKGGRHVEVPRRIRRWRTCTCACSTCSASRTERFGGDSTAQSSS